MPCWRCTGAGEIGARDAEPDDAGRPVEFETCPTCKGTGRDPRFDPRVPA